jgi:peroxiredoxin
MKKYTSVIILLLLSIPGLYAFQSGNLRVGFTITGEIKGLKHRYIYFRHTDHGKDMFDSCALRDGKFNFKGSVSEPQQVFLYTNDGMLQKVFYAENVALTVSGDVSDLQKVIVKGSKSQDEFMVLESEIAVVQEKAYNLYMAAEAATKAGDSLKSNELQAQSTEIRKTIWDVYHNYIVSHPKSVASLQALLIWTNEKNYETARAMFDNLDPSLRSMEKANELTKRFESLSKVEIGKLATDFTVNDVAGKPISLSSYRGKYVLLEFWASWCGPCRAENPNLRAIYLKYKDKGFDILGVSLDEKATQWMKAVEKDDLPWTQVSELKGFRGQVPVDYGISGIPANFLVDPSGNIVERNLRGERLNEVIEKLFD